MAEEKKTKTDKNNEPKEKQNKKQKSKKKLTPKQPPTPKSKRFSSESILLEPITTEKAIRQIELENKIAFFVKRKAKKEQIKDELEQTFKVKVEMINTHIRNNKKIAFIKLKSDAPAIDVATKLGLM